MSQYRDNFCKMPNHSNPRNDKGVRAVETALRVLEVVADTDSGIGVSAIAQQLGLTKSGIFRHLQTLLQGGYILQDAENAAYRLGPRAFALSRRVPETASLASIAEGPMRDLRDAFGLSVVFGLPTHNGIFVLKTMASTTPIEIGVRTGSELALHASAQGKVVLAFGRAELRNQLRYRKLDAITPSTIVDQRALDREIAQVRSNGFAVAPGEVLAGINAIAVPVFQRPGYLAGSLAIVGSIQHVEAVPPADMIATLKAAARRIEQKLGNSFEHSN